MKKYFVILFVLVAGLSACKKTADFDAAAQAASDDATISAYLKTNNLPATKDPSGLYYQVTTPGTGAYPTASSTVTVDYVGKFITGGTFDSATGFKTSLGAVVRGWTLGMQYVNPGGTIILYVPSGLGYGNTATGSIPANTILIFTIKLNSIN